MNIKISIISINYNNKEGLKKTVESIINQTYKNFEYIIIDGGSTDGSTDILEEYHEKINYAVSEPDSGIYNAMNKGIQVSKGDYLLFLNSGDCFVDQFVMEKVIPKLNDGLSIYYGNLIYSSNGIPTILNTPPDELSFYYFINYSLPHPASFIKRELYFKYFTYNESLKIISDWEFFIYVICKMNESYKHIDIVITDFDDAGISSMKENNSILIRERERELVFKKHFPLFINDITSLEEIKSEVFLQYKLILSGKFRRKILKRVIKILLFFKSDRIPDYRIYYKEIK